MNKTNKQSGFTLIELMVATVIFSVVLLVILASFLQIGRMYYKGISYSNTQEAARRVADDLTNEIRFSNSTSYVGLGAAGHANLTGDSYYFCVGNHRYVYTLYEKVTADNMDNPLSGIQQTTIASGCPPPEGFEDGTAGTERRQLLTPDMQLNRFKFECIAGKCEIGLHIIFYGADNQVFASNLVGMDTPDEALRAPDAFCTGALISSQFCASVDLNTTLLTRQ